MDVRRIIPFDFFFSICYMHSLYVLRPGVFSFVSNLKSDVATINQIMAMSRVHYYTTMLHNVYPAKSVSAILTGCLRYQK